MKIYNVIITSFNDGCVETSVRSFASCEKATEYLHEEYLAIKAECSVDEQKNDLDIDEVENITERRSFSFYIEVYSGNYWCSGEVKKETLTD